MSLREQFEKHVEATSVCWVEEMRSRLFARNANGGYYEWSGLESRFQDFAAGHAAGLEAGAKVADANWHYETAAAIRAMKP